MARETKVGLLVGLAFIICFAVILTSRSRDSTASPPRPVMTDSGGHVPNNLQQQASRTPVRPPMAPPTSGSDLVLLDRGPNAPAAAPTRPASDVGERNLTSRNPDPGMLGMLPQTTSFPIQAANPAMQPAPIPKTHTVAPGDTLSKVALTHYGSRSRSAVDAIFAANRTQMDSPDTVKVGMVLTLPDLPTLKGPATVDSAAPEAPRKSAPAAGKVAQGKTPDRVDGGARFYQVKKNDRWISIARDQLGDAGRWRELHELNKDKFPDPQRIREGVRIKLPATLSAHGPGGR